MDSHAIGQGLRRSLVEGELPRLAAFGGHHVYVEIAIVFAGEGQRVAVRVRARRDQVEIAISVNVAESRRRPDRLK